MTASESAADAAAAGAAPLPSGPDTPPDAALDAHQRVRELGLLEEAARLLGAAEILSDIHAVIVRAAALIVGTSSRQWRASLLMLDGDCLRRVAVYDEAGIDLAPRELPLDDFPALRRVIETREQMYGDASLLSSGIPEDFAGEVRAAGLAYAVLTPVATSSEVFGLLGLSTRDASRHDDVPVRRLASVAQLGALAIANARHLAEQRRVAERAQAVEQAKTRLLNLAAHELRGPITVVRGYLSMLADGSVPPEPRRSQEIVSLLLAQTSQINRIVEQMLESTRLEEGRVELRRERVDLRHTVADVVSVMAPLLGERRVRLVCGDVKLPVHGDRIRLGSVVTNLLDNAGKYSTADSPIEVVCAAVDGELASIAVRDHGIGLTPADQDVLFTRFGRIPSPLTSHIQGAGLGLWLSREIARLHGGEIDVVSEPGRGSTFTLILPLDGRPPGPLPEG